MAGNGDSQQYCLRWNNHRSNLLNVFDQLLQTEAFTDVTLAVNGTSIKCHKMVLAACSSYFQSLFLENSCAHPIVVFKDIQYSEIRAILEYMYRGEVNVAQEELPSLLKVAEALRVKGLFEEVSDSVGLATSSANNPSTSNAQSQAVRSTSGLNSGKNCSADSMQSLSSSSSTGSAKQNHSRARSATPTRTTASSPHPPPSPSILPSPQVQLNTAETQNLLYTRHPFLYKSPLLASPAEQGNPLGMWPPLMPLHLGAIESALREREQALALAGLQRDREEKELGNSSGTNAKDRDLPSGGSGSSASSGGNKRKRLSSLAADAEGPLLRSFLGPQGKSGDIPGLFPFRLAGEGTSDERNPLGLLPNMAAYSERQISRERDDDWSQNPDMASEDDQAEVSGDYGGHAAASPLSDKRDASGARIAAYVPTQKLEWKRYKQYTTSDISAAIDAVRNGMSALQASRKFKVPSRTLYDKVKKLGIATTRPYSRVSSSSSSTSLNQNSSLLSNYASSTAAFTSAMASALSLVKRERGPVIQVAGSDLDGNPDAANEDGSRHTPENPASPPNGKDRHDDEDDSKQDKRSSSPYNLQQRPFFAVRDELNSADSAAERRAASPASGST